MSADAAVEEDAGEYETMSADAAEEEDAGEYEAETRGLLDGSAATPGPAAPAPPPPLRSVMLALVPIAYVPGFFQSLYEYVIDPVMPLYAKSLGCNDTEVGIIVAGMLIGIEHRHTEVLAEMAGHGALAAGDAAGQADAPLGCAACHPPRSRRRPRASRGSSSSSREMG